MYDKYFKPWQFLFGTHYFAHCEGFILENIDNNNINNKPEISVIFKNDFIHYSTCVIHMEKRKEGREEKGDDDAFVSILTDHFTWRMLGYSHTRLVQML